MEEAGGTLLAERPGTNPDQAKIVNDWNELREMREALNDRGEDIEARVQRIQEGLRQRRSNPNATLSSVRTKHEELLQEDYDKKKRWLERMGVPRGEIERQLKPLDPKERLSTMPGTEQQLRDRLDKKLQEILATDSQDERQAHEKAVPQIVVRHIEKDSEMWDQLGWGGKTGEKIRDSEGREVDEYVRDKVVSEIMKVLNIGKSQANQLMYLLIAANKKPQEVLTTLSQSGSTYQEYLRTGKFQGDDVDKAAVNVIATRHVYEAPPDKEAASKFLFIYNDLDIKAVGDQMSEKYGKDLGDLSSAYILRFVLDEEFRKTLDSEFDGALPQNLFDLAWNKSYREQEEFGMNGKFPILQMQIEQYEEDGQTKTRGRYIVNTANHMEWIRKQEWKWYDLFDTQEVTDYFSKIELHKGPMYNLNFITMLFDEDRYFRDETGYKWQRLWDSVLLEPWMMMFLRTYQIEYEKAMKDDTKLAEAYETLFYMNKLTMKIYGKSMLQILTTLPVDFHGLDSDTKMGEAWLKMFLTLYNIADFKKLKEVLGEDSPFFTKDAWDKVAETVFAGQAKRTHMPTRQRFYGEREVEYKKAFTDKETGEIKNTIQDQKAFLSFINVYDSEHPSENLWLAMREMLKDVVAEQMASKEGNLDSPHWGKGDKTIDGKVRADNTLNMAWLTAESLSAIGGAWARGNYETVSGHNAETKWLFTDKYRHKYIKYGGAGNYHQILMFPQLSLPFFEGILLENEFNPYFVYDPKTGKATKVKERQITPMEMFNQMNETSNIQEKQRKPLRTELDSLKNDTSPEAQTRKKQIMKELDEIDEVARNIQQQQAFALEFNRNAMRVYSKNLIGRAKGLYEGLMKGEQVSFDKFIHYDGLFRGPSFDRQAWQEAIQKTYITPLRYLFDANGATQLNMKFRAPRARMAWNSEKGKWEPKWEWQDMYVGERMLGHQVLDIPEFRKRKRDCTDEEWARMKKEGYRTKGKWIVRPDGKHEIDYNKVQANKSMVYKQWLLMKIGADLWQHIDRHSTDPAFTLHHYDSIVKAIKELPGELDASEFDMKSARISEGFFSHHQMKWLKRISGADQLFFTEFVKAIFIGDPRKKEGGFGESTRIILSGIFKGY